MIDKDFKDLQEQDYVIDKKHLIVILISSILITFIYQFHLKGYFFEAMLPFILILGSYLIILKESKKNKKAYYMLIPITLIFISDIIVGIDASNKDLNFLVLPVLLSMMFLLLINKNYKLEGNIITWIFKLFPIGLFSNLKFLKIKTENEKSKKIGKILAGIGFGLLFSVVIMSLLIKADDYFGAFVNNIFHSIEDFNLNYIAILVISFILIFSVFINILKNKDTKMNEVKKRDYDKTTIITFLSIVNSVFVLFIISEVSRLTTNFLQIPIEYTYSSYAREGFFQLLFVTMINYAILMFFWYKTNMTRDSFIKWLLFSLITFSIILIFNSYYRMFLYINHYGFTVLRMQVVLFLLMELIIFILMSLKTFNKFKKKNAFIYFIIMISFYIINLYTCNDWLINILNGIVNK